MKQFNKTKRTISALTACMLISSVCYAGSYTAEYKDGGIVVRGTADGRGDNVYVTVYPKGTAALTVDKLLAMTEKKSSIDNGAVEIEFGLVTDRADLAAVDGIDIYVKADSAATPEKITKDYDFSGVDSFISSIKSDCTKANVLSLFTDSANADVMEIMGISEFSSIQSAAEQEMLAGIFAKSIDKDELKADNIKKNYLAAKAVTDINNNTDMESAFTVLNLGFEGAEYSSLTDATLKIWIKNQAAERTYESLSELEAAYKKDNILYLINNERSANMKDTIGKYAADLGIADNTAYKDFAALTGERLSDISDALVNALTSSPAKSANDLTGAVSKVLNPGTANPGGGTGSSGSSGGSSGGGGGFSSGSGNKSYFGVSGGSNPVNVAPQAAFTDLGSVAWAQPAITFLSNRGIINGVGNGKFAPQSRVTREQFVKILIGAANIRIDNGVENPFNDIKKTDWCCDYVTAAHKCGIITGKTATKFGVGEEITRQDAAVMAYRAAGLTGIKLAAAPKTDFSDYGEISDYAKETVGIMAGNGIINGLGNGCFAPKNSCTRAEAAKIVYELFFTGK